MLERSSLLADLPTGLVHGFSTRMGGVSSGRHASLNLGAGGDDPDRVAENLARLARAGGFRPEKLCTVRQVHGAAVLRGRDRVAESQADALWWGVEDGAGIVAVRTADCVPVLLADRAGRAVAAVHSGWRGTVAGVVPTTVRVLMAEAGVTPESLIAAIGPCIERTRFEVGPEVASQFPSRFVHEEGHERPRVDLVAAVWDQLVEAGVPAEQIERVGGCTHSNPDRYFSYRRDGAGSGQHLSFIGFAD